MVDRCGKKDSINKTTLYKYKKKKISKMTVPKSIETRVVKTFMDYRCIPIVLFSSIKQGSFPL